MRRRSLLLALAGALSLGAGRARAQDVGQWFPLAGDDGRPVANLRLPVELTSEVEDLQGAIWVGSDQRAVTIVEFYDYNCPYCRAAATDLHALLQAEPDLRLGLVNNPILSPASAEAARVEIALSLLGRPATIYEIHRRLFARRGPIDGAMALEVAGERGAPLAKVRELMAGPDVREILDTQMRLAASLGFRATPAFLIAGAGVLGYPGPNALRRVVDAVRRCGEIAC